MAPSNWEDADDRDEGNGEGDGGDYCVEEESLESLEAKLAEYEKSLQDVKIALEMYPDEPEVEKLFKDLQELVSLYKDLVEIRSTTEPKRGRQSELASGAAAAALGSDSTFRAYNEGGATTATAETHAGDLYGSSQDQIGIEQQQQQTTVPVVDVTTNLKSLLNRACYAYYERVLYVARVISVHPTSEATDEAKTPKVVVEYIGWGNKEVLAVDEIRLLPAVNNLTAGASCWAVNQTDGLWYLATVSRPDKEKGVYYIRFRDSNESLTISNDQVSIKTPFACIGNVPTIPSNSAAVAKDSSGQNNNKRPTREIVTPGGYRIPEKLTIKPEDSEKVKQMKKKKVSLIKKEQRKELIEQDARHRQSSWRSHAAVATKKLKVKGSIFRTTDNQQSKVGVTGSGQKMTQYATRARHDYEEMDEEV